MSSPFSAFERLLLPLARRLAALWVRPAVLPEDVRERLAAASGPLVYVLEKRSVVDVAVLEHCCRELGLPTPLQPVSALPGPSLACVFLERRAGWLGQRIDRRPSAELRLLVEQAGPFAAAGGRLLPVSLFWGRAPGRERSWFKLLVAESWDIGGRLRKLASLAINGRNLLVLFSDPQAVTVELAEPAGLPVAARRLWRQLRLQLRNQRTETIGPDLSHRRTVVTQVLRTAEVRAAVRAEMLAKGLSRRDALKVARGYAEEIAANYSHPFVAFMYRVLGRLWNRLYDGVELANFSSLASVPEGSEIVYVPCHRSHMDYLLLSYVVFHKGYAVPHIAAGINLNLPLVGPWLRRGGAFFLRRSFSGNALYAAVFSNYLGQIMARGHSIEYFIEGGRSRTGRLLQPKTGMLAMTLRSYLRRPVRPVVFVPVYFGYERLVEGRTYLGELSGQPKEKESVFGLLKAIPALRSRFGKVYVSFGEPLALESVLADRATPEQRAALGGEDRPDWFRGVVDELAVGIMQRINAAACVSPVNLVALVLLATPRQSMVRTDLARQLELYASLLRQAPYSPRVWISPADGESMIRYAESLGLLGRRAHELGDIAQMGGEHSALSAYARNNVQHLLLLPSLLAAVFLNNTQVRREVLHRLAWRVYPYAAQEYFLHWSPAELGRIVDELLEDLLNHGLLSASPDREVWERPAAATREAVQLSLLAHVSLPMLERYYLAISLLLRAGSGRLSPEALETQCQLMAQRMALLYELDSPEFFDRALFRAFIERLRERAVLSLGPDGRLQFEPRMVEAVLGDAQYVLHEQVRNSILQVLHH
jgi:glycerol-3-phosphate O-acyltransferase